MKRGSGVLRRFRAVAIKRPGGHISLRVRRQGVEPTAGCLLAFPIWLVTRLRWQSSDRLWTAEMAAAGRLGINRTVRAEDFPSFEEAMARALEWYAAAEAGACDYELEPTS